MLILELSFIYVNTRFVYVDVPSSTFILFAGDPPLHTIFMVVFGNITHVFFVLFLNWGLGKGKWRRGLQGGELNPHPNKVKIQVANHLSC